jgi:hypothetical protein
MSIDYSWVICALECAPNIDGREKVVSLVYWRRHGVNTDGIMSDISGSQEIEYHKTNVFTPYEDLTPTKIIGWIEDNMTPEQIAALDAILETQINEKANPTVVLPPLPWAE